MKQKKINDVYINLTFLANINGSESENKVILEG